MLGILELVGQPIIDGLGRGTSFLIVAGFAAVWAGVVTLFASRSIGDEVRDLLDLAERGLSPDAEAGHGDDPASTPQRRLTATIEERNRQLAELVERLRRAPISDDAETVARATVAAARSVTANPTWMLVVLGPSESALAPAVYGGELDAPAQLAELHFWAASSGDDPSRPRLVDGPWGRFMVVPVDAADSGLRALLLSPWEGRAAPSNTEINLLELMGGHAAAAIEHAMLYAELRTRTDQLDRMAAVQTDFLRGVTHDLQTPLTSIGALAAELQEKPDTDAIARVDLQTIAYQADRLRRMVSQLLVVSRLEVGAVQPRQEVFRLEPIIQRTWHALRADRPFSVSTNGPEFLAVADADRIEQVLWALLDNAVKYSPPGSPIAVEIGSRRAPNGELRARVTVVDRGAGMDDETAAHAFDQFYRAPAARAEAPDGSGVGLYAASGLIRAMDGSLRFERGADGETRIIFETPAEPIQEARGAASEVFERRRRRARLIRTSRLRYRPRWLTLQGTSQGHAPSMRIIQTDRYRAQ